LAHGLEPYERVTPWKKPRYELSQRIPMQGCDCSKHSVAEVRWYLLMMIDFFSRWIIAHDVVPMVNA
jgi:hypothetical protein